MSSDSLLPIFCLNWTSSSAAANHPLPLMHRCRRPPQRTPAAASHLCLERQPSKAAPQGDGRKLAKALLVLLGTGRLSCAGWTEQPLSFSLRSALCMFAAGAAAAAASIRAEQGPGPHQRESGQGGEARDPAQGRREERQRGEEAGRGARGRESLSSRDEHNRGSDRRAEDDYGGDRYGPRWREDDQDKEAQAEDRRRIPPSSQAPHEPRGRRPQERKGQPRQKGAPKPPPAAATGTAATAVGATAPGEDVSYPPRDQRQPCPDDRACFNYGKTGHLARDCPSAPAEGEAVCSLPCNAQSTGDNSTTGSSQLCSGLPLSSPLCFVPSPPPPTPTLLPYPTGLLQTVTDE